MRQEVGGLSLNDDKALIDYAKPIVNELRANMVRVEVSFLRSQSGDVLADLPEQYARVT